MNTTRRAPADWSVTPGMLSYFSIQGLNKLSSSSLNRKHQKAEDVIKHRMAEVVVKHLMTEVAMKMWVNRECHEKHRKVQVAAKYRMAEVAAKNVVKQGM